MAHGSCPLCDVHNHPRPDVLGIIPTVPTRGPVDKWNYGRVGLPTPIWSINNPRAPRATWIQTELFLTFPTPVIRAITLIPLTSPETGGRFRVWLDKGIGGVAELVWDRKVSVYP